MWQLTICTANHCYEVYLSKRAAKDAEDQITLYWAGRQNGEARFVRVIGKRGLGDKREYRLLLPFNEIQLIALDEMLTEK